MATLKPIDYSVSLAASGTSPDLIPPTGYTVQQLVTNLANGVLAAYTAYQNSADPVLTGYGNITPIYVYEWDASQWQWNPYLFGFAASANDNTHNIVALRGTADGEEAGDDLYSWGTNTPCIIPVGSTKTPPPTYGNVNAALYNFYAQGTGSGSNNSLSVSFNDAVKTVAGLSSATDWYVAGHSLGGPIATLGAWDAYANGSFEAAGATPQPTLVTFGGLHLGDADFVSGYTSQLPQGIRFANQCDFVPSLVALMPSDTPPTDPYATLGQPATFVWQFWNDWANHSMANVYQPMVSNDSYWNLIGFGQQTYPQAG